MKQILTLMRQDLTNSLRDNIVVYIIIAPLLLALAVKVFFPTFAAAGLNFAVDARVDREIVTALEQYGTLEIFAGEKEVLARVEQADVVPGIIARDGGIALIFEGNEPKSIVDSYTSILQSVTSPKELVSKEHRKVGSEGSLLYEYIIVMLTMMVAFMSAVVSGFNIVHDKETRALQAISVSPLQAGGFMAARGATVVGISIVVSVLSSLILTGLDINYFNLILAMLLSGLLTTLVALLLGTLAENQIMAIAVLKVLMPVYMFLPLVSIFVSEKVQFFFYPLPNYWQFKMLENIFINGDTLGSAALLTVVTSTLFLTAIMPLFRRKLKLR